MLWRVVPRKTDDSVRMRNGGGFAGGASPIGCTDEFEQPFHSVDLTYSWYPTYQMTLTLKGQNLLDEEIEIQRGSVVVFREKPGVAISTKVKYSF